MNYELRNIKKKKNITLHQTNYAWLNLENKLRITIDLFYGLIIIYNGRFEQEPRNYT